MRIWPASLFGRNLLLIVALVVLGQMAGALLASQLLVRPRLERAAELAAGQISALRQGIAALPPSQRPAFIQAFNRRVAAEPAAGAPWPRYLVPMQRRFIQDVSALLSRDDAALVWRSSGDAPLSVRLTLDGDEHWIVVPQWFAAREFSGTWLGASLAGALLALAGAGFIQRRINRPLGALVAATAQLGRGERPERLPEDGPLEIAAVSASFNRMTADLERQEQERAVMLAGISHDLRTPMTKMRLSVEILRGQREDELLDGMVRHLDDMDAMVGQFLEFARAGDAQGLEPVLPGCDLDMLAREVAQTSAAQGHPVQLDLGGLPSVPLRPLSVRRAIANLVANAHRHGAMPVVLGTRIDGAWVRITVCDHGPGIPPDERERVRQPFQRAQRARTGPAGTGLGLAIADRVARAHGGRLELATAPQGGLLAALVLPSQPPPAAANA